MSEPSYPRATWRLIVDPEPRTGAWNMALDEAIQEAVAAGAAPPTLRFYQWAPPALSLGKRQPLDGVDLSRCRRDGVDVVRRPTGGLAILHTDELTYSIATLPDDPRAAGAILDAYKRLSAGLVAGLRRLGVAAEMNPVNPYGTHTSSAACFEAPSAYEITAGGKKLMGSAQTRPAGRVLQHGSLPLVGDIARVADYLSFTSAAERAALRAHLAERATTLRDALGHAVAFDTAAAALGDGFAAALNLDLAPASISDAELRAAEERLPLVVVSPDAAGTRV
ncbi:MAG TPA: lipoate--protein ligase family protein [Ktedonobacterales bacterium]|nr:lipoate--protein ligase family protein [Ktedonobacterales bacterium]